MTGAVDGARIHQRTNRHVGGFVSAPLLSSLRHGRLDKENALPLRIGHNVAQQVSLRIGRRRQRNERRANGQVSFSDSRLGNEHGRHFFFFYLSFFQIRRCFRQPASQVGNLSVSNAVHSKSNRNTCAKCSQSVECKGAREE